MKIGSFEDPVFGTIITMSIHQSRLERENLEAHVDLCAERYRVLEEKFNRLDGKMDSITESLEQMNANSRSDKDRSAKLMVTVGASVIVGLITVIVMLMINLQSVTPPGV